MNRKICVSLFSIFFLCAFSAGKKKNLDIVFIGDSITHGATLKDPKTESPPVYAAAFLRSRHGMGEVRFSNQGVSGFTTVDFLPVTRTAFKNVVKAADAFYKDQSAMLIFSIMLGTNDSAADGPNGSPVSPRAYRLNLKKIIDDLLRRYPSCKIIIHRPIWYSVNTYNSSRYLAEGLVRLQEYFPEIDTLAAHYAASHPHRVFTGDKKAFHYFKKHYHQYYTPQQGRRGIFYLHPDKAGAARLGRFWGKAIYKALFRQK